MSGSASVTAAEIIRNFGHWQRQALIEPLTITHHGRARAMLVSVEQFAAMDADHRAAATREADCGARAQLATILRNTSEGFLACDSSLHVADMNHVAEAFFGKAGGDGIGKPVDHLFPGGAGAYVAESVRRVLRSGEIVTLDVNGASAGGRRLALRIFPYLEGAGLLFTNATEIEHLRSADEAWRACAEALDRNPAACWLKLDGSGRIVHASTGAARFTGYSPATLMAISLADLVHPADRPRFAGAFEALMQTRQPALAQVSLSAGDGPERPIHLSLAPLWREATPHGALAILSAGAAADQASRAA